jgi:hypothetical protein
MLLKEAVLTLPYVTLQRHMQGGSLCTDEECHRFAADVDITSLDVIGRIGADLTAGLPPSGPLEHVG